MTEILGGTIALAITGAAIVILSRRKGVAARDSADWASVPPPRTTVIRVISDPGDVRAAMLRAAVAERGIAAAVKARVDRYEAATVVPTASFLRLDASQGSFPSPASSRRLRSA